MYNVARTKERPVAMVISSEQTIPYTLAMNLSLVSVGEPEMVYLAEISLMSSFKCSMKRYQSDSIVGWFLLKF